MPSLDFKLALVGDLKKDIEGDLAAIARGYTSGITLRTEALKQRLRAQVIGGGLGQRLANSIRSQVFPERAVSMSAVGSVFTRKSGHIVLGHSGTVIRPGNGRTYLAIPTENVPPKRRSGGFGSKGSLASPFEVETVFNQDLKFFRTRSGTVLAYIEAVKSKSKRGWRSATKGRVRQGRKIERVIMFILVPQVRLKKRLDVDAALTIEAAAVPETVAREIDRELAGGE